MKIVRLIDIYFGITLAYLVFFAKKLFRQGKCFGVGIDYKKILLVKFWGAGNVIMLLPAVRALKEKFPAAKIDFLTLSNNKQVLKLANIFDTIYTIDINGLVSFINTTLKNISVIKKEEYDLIIDFEQFARFSAIFSSFVGRKNIMGFNTLGQHRHFLYTSCVTYNNSIHITKSFFSLAELAGAVSKDDIIPVPLYCEAPNICKMKEVLHSYGISADEILIIMHIGTSENFQLRRWMPEYFANLADRLVDNFSVRVIFTGLSNEGPLVNICLSYIGNKEKVFNVTGKLDFNQFTALIKLSDLVISADTAPVHLAASLSIPTVGLYGPNSPYLYGPWGESSIWFYKKLNCSPCITNYNAKINKCRHPEGQGACMRKISTNEVFSGIKSNFFDENARFRLNKLSRDLRIVRNG